MQKFLVIVNCKYLVMVEAETCGGAEHKILDEIYHGIEMCQAFSMSEISTDFFKCRAEECETISFSEMQGKAEEYKRTLDKLEEYKASEKRCAENIKLHEEEIEVEKNSMITCQLNIANLETYKNSIW